MIISFDKSPRHGTVFPVRPCLAAVLGCLVIGLFVTVFFTSCATTSQEAYRLQPSGYVVTNPNDWDTPFETYIEGTRESIRNALIPRYADGDSPFLGNYSIDQVVDMRSPFALYPSPDQDCSETASRGFLLMHGLTDTAYNMRPLAESLRERFPCGIFFVPLMAGHGTVPGDSKEVRYHDWLATFEYALTALKRESENIYLLGYSAGGTMIIEYLTRVEDDAVKAAVLLAPGIQLASRLASLATALKLFIPYASTHPDVNAVKYESTSANFASEFYMLTQSIDKEQSISQAVFVLGTSDDNTLDARSINRFFCHNLSSDQSRMLWYQGKNRNLEQCPGIGIIQSSTAPPALNFVNHSHVAIVAPPDDPHYGFQGLYSNCEHYSGEEEYEACIGNDNGAIYGERNILNDASLLDQKLLRRSTFNPFYDGMIADIADFLASK